jgi:hypothetical protein
LFYFNIISFSNDFFSLEYIWRTGQSYFLPLCLCSLCASPLVLLFFAGFLFASLVLPVSLSVCLVFSCCSSCSLVFFLSFQCLCRLCFFVPVLFYVGLSLLPVAGVLTEILQSLSSVSLCLWFFFSLVRPSCICSFVPFSL